MKIAAACLAALALASCETASDIKRINELDDLEFSRLEQRVQAYAHVGTWAAVEAAEISDETIAEAASLLEALADSESLVEGANGVLSMMFDDTEAWGPIVSLMMLELDSYLDTRGFWAEVGPRTRGLLFAVATGMRSAIAPPTIADEATAESVEAEMRLDDAAEEAATADSLLPGI